MTFTSLTFLLFALIVVSAYWAISKVRIQNLLLLSASYFFYGWWDWRFCFLILASSVFDYWVARRLDAASKDSIRRRWLCTSIAANLSLLGIFKYFHFFVDSFQSTASAFGWQVPDTTLEIVLPVGISFYTFQTLGYTIDVFRRKTPACKDFVVYLTFVSFFPQLVAGPIERASAMLSQFQSPRTFESDLATSGCRLILWGFAKKLIIADRLAIFVNECYSDPGSFGGPMLALATVLFAFQIYCDFSAYSDIAIGTGRLLGIRLSRNFAYPYFSQSITEFWRRWHISLSSWFRDYVYIPLGGSRHSRPNRFRNLLVTFLTSGLWHGAAWHFVFWGGINGVAVASESGASESGRTANWEEKPGGDRFLPRPATAFRIGMTFALVCVAWVFFRATSIGAAFEVLRKVITDSVAFRGFGEVLERIDQDSQLAVSLALLLGFVTWEWLARDKECPLQLNTSRRSIRWATYSAVIWITLIAIPSSGSGEFIYFAF